jgi:hypothetical protein
MSFFGAQSFFDLLFNNVIEYDLDRAKDIRAITFRISGCNESFFFQYFFLHSSLAVCCSLFGYYLLFFLKFTNDTLVWRCLLIGIYKEL